MERSPFSIEQPKPTPGIVDQYFNASTGDGDEGEIDMRGPWQTSFGLNPVESEMNGGPGLSVEDVSGTEKDQGERGKQDAGQKSIYSPFAESETQPSLGKSGFKTAQDTKTRHSQARKSAKKTEQPQARL